jgi:HAD superfamily hydrolase (TIGR01509 family)
MAHLPSTGVVFDLDGVLIDSHDQHEQGWFRLAEEIGQPLTSEQFKRSFGMRNEMCIPDVFGWARPDETEKIRDLGERKEELYRLLLSEGGLVPLPGVVDLLDGLVAAAIPFSLGSSTSRKNIEVCFAATGLDSYFGDRFVGAEDVTRGKPAPDVFLEAARRIDRDPGECIVIEDAHVGIEAALAAGMAAVAVTTTHPRESLANCGASRIVNSLEELTPETLQSLVESS